MANFPKVLFSTQILLALNALAALFLLKKDFKCHSLPTETLEKLILMFLI